MNNSRREFLTQASAAVIATLASSSHAFAFSEKYYEGVAGFIGEANSEVFHKLSQWLTQRENLDKNDSDKVYAAIRQEPWGNEHVVQIYGKIAPLFAEENKTLDVAKLIDSQFFNDGERWFISHLLLTWYLGIYYHEEREDQRILYETALMHNISREAVPVRFFDRTPFGEWAKPSRGM